LAKIAGNKLNVTLNAVAIEDELTGAELKLEEETIKVDSLASVGPERVVANYDWSMSADGNADFASGQGDATIFGMVGSSGVSLGFDPTGASAAPNDPNYDGTVVLKSYSIKAGVGQPVQYKAEFEGTSALARNVA